MNLNTLICKFGRKSAACAALILCLGTALPGYAESASADYELDYKPSESAAVSEASDSCAENAEKAEENIEDPFASEKERYGQNSEKYPKFKFSGLAEINYVNTMSPVYTSGTSGLEHGRASKHALSGVLELRENIEGEDLKFAVSARYDSSKDMLFIKDLKLVIPVNQNLDFTLGRYKSPFGIEVAQGDDECMTINKSAVSRAECIGRGIGFNAAAKLDGGGRFVVGLINDHNDKRFLSSDYILTAKGVIPVCEGGKFGLSAEIGSHKNIDNIQIPVRRLGGEYQYKNDKWRFDAELIYSSGWNMIGKADSRALGGYAYTACTVNPQLDAVIGLDWFDPDLDKVNLEKYSANMNAASRILVGVNYYFDRKMVRRLMLNYEITAPTEGPKHITNGFYIKYQHAF